MDTQRRIELVAVYHDAESAFARVEADLRQAEAMAAWIARSFAIATLVAILALALL
jgi:hypothetical protein